MSQRIAVSLLAVFLSTAALGAAQPSLAQTGVAGAPAKKAVNTRDDLPRYNYPISGTATALLTAEKGKAGQTGAVAQHHADGGLRDLQRRRRRCDGAVTADGVDDFQLTQREQHQGSLCRIKPPGISLKFHAS